MQNSLLILAVVVLAGGALYYVMNSGSPAPADESMTTDTAPAAEPTATDNQPMPDTAADAEPAEESDASSESAPDIVDTAVANDDFNTLVTAVTEAELVDTLKADGPYTVFAPTDAAFAALPDGTLDTLLQPENQADLAGVLTYHVVPGAVTSGDLSDGMTVETVNGETITFGVSDAGVTVNDATVVMADIETSNGVIHVIDAVLLPE